MDWESGRWCRGSGCLPAVAQGLAVELLLLDGPSPVKARRGIGRARIPDLYAWTGCDLIGLEGSPGSQVGRIFEHTGGVSSGAQEEAETVGSDAGGRLGRVGR